MIHAGHSPNNARISKNMLQLWHYGLGVIMIGNRLGQPTAGLQRCNGPLRQFFGAGTSFWVCKTRRMCCCCHVLRCGTKPYFIPRTSLATRLRASRRFSTACRAFKSEVWYFGCECAPPLLGVHTNRCAKHVVLGDKGFDFGVK